MKSSDHISKRFEVSRHFRTDYKFVHDSTLDLLSSKKTLFGSNNYLRDARLLGNGELLCNDNNVK
jgi:hypothetical protein